jgi:hypothetical protein
MDGAAAQWEERSPSNVCGMATAITTMAPMRRRKVLALRLAFWMRRHVAPYRELKARPLRRLSFIHFAQWTLVRRLPGQPLSPTYLCFESNFNGSFDAYIDSFAYVVPRLMKGIWRGAYGFPGPQPATPFKAYIERHEYPAAHFYSAYPEATTTRVSAALALRQRFDALVARTRGAPPDAFAEEWRDFLRDTQAWL